MALRAEFAIIYFGEHLGDKESDLSTSATFAGNQTTIKTFEISGAPTSEAYVLLQLFDVNAKGHKILINGIDLGGWDVPPKPNEWQLWMDVIDTKNLKQGNNTIQIVRDTSTGDNFIVEHAVIHWKESK